VLGLQIENIDLDNMLFTLQDKGRKDRKVPFSYQLRKALFKLSGLSARLCGYARQNYWTGHQAG
jgi:site-specific recombinase XerD